MSDPPHRGLLPRRLDTTTGWASGDWAAVVSPAGSRSRMPASSSERSSGSIGQLEGLAVALRRSRGAESIQVRPRLPIGAAEIAVRRPMRVATGTVGGTGITSQSPSKQRLRCHISAKALESQTVTAFSLGLREDSLFRAHTQ